MQPPVLFRFAAFAAIAAAWALISAAQTSPPALRWFKGNLHTHTINSDGDSSPDAVARWYKERRYNFLALTDHNYFSDPQGLNSFLGASDRFLLIRGEEVTSRFEESAIHVNAFKLKSVIEPAFGDNIVDTIQQNVDRIRAAGAVPSLNHPNFRWSVSPEQLARIDGLPLFEVYNGHPQTNSLGGGDAPGLEQLWDIVLSSGKRLYGIAVDDAHNFKQLGPELSNPGRGWIEVYSAELSEEALLAAVEGGDFYASTGVRLKRVERGGGLLKLAIDPAGDARYEIRFSGKNGDVLAESSGLEGEYRLRPGDAYVRATVTDSNGRKAWVQPVFQGAL
jgi:predicted metal-dependent phosphoesterase TrpH